MFGFGPPWDFLVLCGAVLAICVCVVLGLMLNASMEYGDSADAEIVRLGGIVNDAATPALHPSACKSFAECVRNAHRAEQAEAKYESLRVLYDDLAAAVDAHEAAGRLVAMAFDDDPGYRRDATRVQPEGGAA